jgi:predicted TIM-barrel fold metal-dependent hydrolase
MTQAWRTVPSDRYLDEALQLTELEAERLHRVLDQLPDKIKDGHTHMAERSQVTSDFPDALMLHPVSSYPAYGYEAALIARTTLWPGKVVGSLRMAHAFRGFDYRSINQGLARTVATHGDVFATYGLPDDIEYTIESLKAEAVVALKMYYSYRDPPFTEIREIFPHDVLRTAEAKRVPIILHLPNPLPANVRELDRLVATYPALRIVLAHIGGHGAHYCSEAIVKSLHELAVHPNIFADTALVFDEALVSAALQAFGPQRVLFGTDEPLSLIRVVNYNHPMLGPRFYAPRYHWAQEEDAPTEVRTRRPELVHLLQLEAVTSACLQSGGDATIQAVFRSNATNLYRFNA